MRGPTRVADIGGDRGDWTVVRSRKRKAGRRDRSGISERQGGTGQIRARDRRGFDDLDNYSRFRTRQDGW